MQSLNLRWALRKLCGGSLARDPESPCLALPLPAQGPSLPLPPAKRSGEVAEHVEHLRRLAPPQQKAALCEVEDFLRGQTINFRGWCSGLHAGLLDQAVLLPCPRFPPHTHTPPYALAPLPLLRLLDSHANGQGQHGKRGRPGSLKEEGTGPGNQHRRAKAARLGTAKPLVHARAPPPSCRRSRPRPPWTPPM